MAAGAGAGCGGLSGRSRCLFAFRTSSTIARHLYTVWEDFNKTDDWSRHLPFLIIKDKIKAKFISLRFKVIKFPFICKILSSELKLGLFEQASFLLNLKILSEFIQ